jgi:hypothetical protein
MTYICVGDSQGVKHGIEKTLIRIPANRLVMVIFFLNLTDLFQFGSILKQNINLD